MTVVLKIDFSEIEQSYYGPSWKKLISKYFLNNFKFAII